MVPCFVYEVRVDPRALGGEVIGYTQSDERVTEYANSPRHSVVVKNALKAPDGTLILDKTIKSLPIVGPLEEA